MLIKLCSLRVLNSTYYKMITTKGKGKSDKLLYPTTFCGCACIYSFCKQWWYTITNLLSDNCSTVCYGRAKSCSHHSTHLVEGKVICCYHLEFAWKVTCWCFDWMLQSSSGWKWKETGDETKGTPGHLQQEDDGEFGCSGACMREPPRDPLGIDHRIGP